jgi:hypothetical protein
VGVGYGGGRGPYGSVGGQERRAEEGSAGGEAAVRRDPATDPTTELTDLATQVEDPATLPSMARDGNGYPKPEYPTGITR